MSTVWLTLLVQYLYIGGKLGRAVAYSEGSSSHAEKYAATRDIALVIEQLHSGSCEAGFACNRLGAPFCAALLLHFSHPAS